MKCTCRPWLCSRLFLSDTELLFLLIFFAGTTFRKVYSFYNENTWMNCICLSADRVHCRAVVSTINNSGAWWKADSFYISWYFLLRVVAALSERINLRVVLACLPPAFAKSKTLNSLKISIRQRRTATASGKVLKIVMTRKNVCVCGGGRGGH